MFEVQLTVLNWDELSSNDHISNTLFDVVNLITDTPKDERTVPYPAEEDGVLAVNWEGGALEGPRSGSVTLSCSFPGDTVLMV